MKSQGVWEAMFDGSDDNGFDFSAPLETVLLVIHLTSCELRFH